MKRATITIPDDLVAAVEGYVRAQEAPPALTAVVQTALRQFLTGRGYVRSQAPLRISPARRGKAALARKTLVHQAIAEGLEDIKKGRVYGPFDTVDEMLASMKGTKNKPARKARRGR